MKHRERLHLRDTFLWFGLIGLPLFVFMVVLLNYIQENQEFRVFANVERKQQEMLSLSKYQLEHLFTGIYDDLNVIRRSNDFEGYLSSAEENAGREAEGMFSRMLDSKPRYYSISYADPEGRNLLSAERSGLSGSPSAGGAGAVSSDGAWRPDPTGAADNTLFVSGFRLDDREEGRIGPDRPVIRFALPVFRGGAYSGFLRIDYDRISFLKILDTYEGSRAFDINQAVIDRDHIIDLNFAKSEKAVSSAISEPSEEAGELWRLIGEGDSVFFDFRGRRYYARQINPGDGFKLQFDRDGTGWLLVSSYNPREVLEEWGVLLIRKPYVKFSSVFILELLIFAFIFIIQQRKTDSLQMEASRYIAEFSHDAIIITDSSQHLMYCNGGFERAFGFPLEEIYGKKPKEFLGGQTVMSLKESDRNDLIWEGNIWDRSKDDIFIQKYLKVKVVKTSLGKPAFYIGVYSEPKFLFAAELSKGLAPSSYFSGKSMEYLYPDMGRSFAERNLNTVILIKIMDIAFLHNQLSDEESDYLIHAVVREIRRIGNGLGTVVIPASDIVLLSARNESRDGLALFMENLDKAVSSLKILDHGFPINYRAGVALAGPDAGGCSALVHNAFIALEALGSMRDVISLVYDESIYESVIRKRKIKDQIENGFDNDEFSLVYQVQEDCRTREIIGVEALLRWNSKELGQVSPALFVPIMEETSQIKRLGKHVVGKILKEFGSISGLIDEKFRISINLSIQEFNDASLVEEIIQMIARSSVSREKICFEITETLLSENLSHTGTIIELFHRNGMTVAIDDFGTGYSSLSYLKNLKADKIKIDRAFIKDYPEKDNGSILKAITKLALDLDINLILEGIETEEQLAFARDLGCQEFQGYLSSRPMPIEALADRLTTRSGG